MPLNLPRLPRNVRLIDANGFPTQVFQQWWQRAAESIEAQFGAIDAAIAAQAAAAAANAAAAAAQTAAAGARGAADGAQAAADATTAQTNLVNSFPSGVTITATDAGSNVTVSVTAHNRIYGGGTSVSVNAGNVTALSYSTLYYVYYDQPSRAGGAVTYVATTTAATAAQTGDRHLVGSVTTPAAAAGPATGRYVAPPGVGNIP